MARRHGQTLRVLGSVRKWSCRINWSSDSIRPDPRPRSSLQSAFEHQNRSKTSPPAVCHRGSVHHKDRLGQGYILEILAKAVLVSPVDRGPFYVQQTALASVKAAVTQATDHMPLRASRRKPAAARFFVSAAARFEYRCTQTSVLRAQFVQAASQRVFRPAEQRRRPAVFTDQGASHRPRGGQTYDWQCAGIQPPMQSSAA